MHGMHYSSVASAEGLEWGPFLVAHRGDRVIGTGFKSQAIHTTINISSFVNESITFIIS